MNANPQSNLMEHRWGVRCAADRGVRIIGGACLGASGRLTQVSASGGFIETTLRMPPLATLQLELVAGYRGYRDGGLLCAQVVRSTPHGMAVEWRELVPDAIAELLTTRSTPRRPAPLERHAAIAC